MNYLLVIRRYAPFKTFGGGFEGDERKAGSNSEFASARTIGFVQFDDTGEVYSYGTSSGSEFNGFGNWVSSKIGRHYSKVNSRISNIKYSKSILSFKVHTEGSNPLVPIVAPDIDTFVSVEVKFSESYISINGTVGGNSFPNAEVLLVDHGAECSVDSTSNLLFDYRTGGGRNTGPFARLAGDGSGEILGDFSHKIPVSSGKFIFSTQPKIVIGK